MTATANAPDNVSFHSEHPEQGDDLEELMHGLQQPQKYINPKYFYDAAGSELFDLITRLPEYYASRTEKTILRTHSAEIAQRCGADCILIEPGSGSSEKVRLLLDQVRPASYVPLDISESFLFDAASQLGREFPWLSVHAVCADFASDWTFIENLASGKRVVFYPGSTLGNLEPEAAQRFLSKLARTIGADGGAIIGVDLHKEERRLNAAYNDAQGITAAFNLNVLDHINPLLNANFDSQYFSHDAFYNQELKRIEMHLVSSRDQVITCNSESIELRRDETIHTENSYKYTVEGFTELAARAGLAVKQTWLDDDQLFSVHYLEPVER